jgi:serpin B
MKNLLYLLATFSLTIILSGNKPMEKNQAPEQPLDEEIKKANEGFAFRFFQEVNRANDKENFMVSPLGLNMVMALAYNGAEGSTKTAFGQALGTHEFMLEDINTYNQTLIEGFNKNLGNTLFSLANSIWLRDGFKVKKDFLETGSEHYQAQIEALDFSQPTAAETINQWADKETHGKIPTIVDKITPLTVMFLVNAVYFNGNWKSAFDPKKNKEMMFLNETTGEKKTKTMMSKEMPVQYAKNGYFTSVILPYKDDAFEMVFFRPEGDHKTTDIINKLDAGEWGQWLGSYQREAKVAVTIPKFKFEYENQLKDELMKMGLMVAFTEKADFSGISSKQIKISEVLQKTYIEVNEKGTEAAAVTSGRMELTSMPAPSEKIVYTLDKSFVFMIIHKESGTICFMGCVNNPEISC